MQNGEYKTSDNSLNGEVPRFCFVYRQPCLQRGRFVLPALPGSANMELELRGERAPRVGAGAWMQE